MPMPVPMPNLMQMIPGMESMATMMMKQKIANKGVASIEELRAACLESGVKLIACQMTVDLFDFKPEDFVGGIEFGGAATFFEFAGESDVNLFI
jgi:peroxiredoxin family protein